MPYVELCSPTNSTMFTTCCGSAILSRERSCPSCNKPVYPYFDNDEPTMSPSEVHNYRWSYAFKRTR